MYSFDILITLTLLPNSHNEIEIQTIRECDIFFLNFVFSNWKSEI